jgi:hypothetical protein
MGADLASDNNPGNGPGNNPGDDPGNQPRKDSGTDPGNHRNSGDVDDFVIPPPRPAPDDDITGLPASPRQTSRQNPWENAEKSQERSQESGSDDPRWWYDQPRKRGADRRYWGEVEWIGGPEADRLRDKLTEIVRDLLDWAHSEQLKSETDSATDSGEDGDTDDTPS